MFMPTPPDNTLHIQVQPHPQTGEPTACLHIELDDGHMFDLFFGHDEFARMVDDMEDALSDLRCLVANWVIVDCAAVEGNHLMEIDGFSNGKRRALCGVHPPKGVGWEALPLVGEPEESDEVCEMCMRHWRARIR